LKKKDDFPALFTDVYKWNREHWMHAVDRYPRLFYYPGLEHKISPFRVGGGIVQVADV
jgi:hypothetical protein